MKKSYLFLVLLLWIGANAVKAEEAKTIPILDGAGFVEALTGNDQNIILEIENDIILTDNVSITDKTVIIRGPENKNPEGLFLITYGKVIGEHDYDLQEIGNIGDIVVAEGSDKTITISDNAAVTIENLRFEGTCKDWRHDHNSSSAFHIETGSLTITNSLLRNYISRSYGSVIHNEATLILNDCIFSNNKSYGAGAAIFNSNKGEVEANRCSFFDHSNNSSYGMVLRSDCGSVTFTDCTIIEGEKCNGTSLFGLIGTTATFIGCRMTGDKTVLYSENSYDTDLPSGSLTLQDCIISESAGGVVCSNTLLIDRCIFKDNTGTLVSIEPTDEEETPTQIIRNSLFVKNSLQKESGDEEEEEGENEEFSLGLIQYSGGVPAGETPLTIANCTFAHNTIEDYNVFFKYTQVRKGLGPCFYNTILDIPEDYAFGFYIEEEGAPPTLNDLVFQNCLTNLESLGENGANKDNRVGITDFGFADEEGDYSLIAGSPALDAGDNTLYSGDLKEDTDLAGNPRLKGNSIDIGAYESQSANAPDATDHTITLEVASGIELHTLTAGELQVEDGSHLHLQFLPEDRTLTADDILLLVDGVETDFKEFDADYYHSYILNPVTADHTILIALREYTVTLPEVEGITYNVGAGMHQVSYGNSFTFSLTGNFDPADIHVFANGQEIVANELRSTVLTYTIDRVTTSIVVAIEGGSTTSNASLTHGVRVIVESGKWKVENEMATAVDVTVYSITGQNMVQLRGLRGSKTITLPAGIYIVRAGQTNTKVIIP